MKKIRMIMAAAVVAVLLPGFGTAAMARGWDGGPGVGMHYGAHRGGGHMAGLHLWKALNLNPEQSQKLKELRESLFTEIVPLRNEITSKRFELRALWTQSNPDETKILAKQKEINGLRADLQDKITKKRLEMRRMLTPEQQAKLVYLSTQSRMWRGHERGHRHGLAHRAHFDQGRGIEKRPGETPQS